MVKRRKIKRTGTNRRKNIFTQFCIMTIFCVLFSAGVAYGWQCIEDKSSENTEKPYSPSEHGMIEENNVVVDNKTNKDQTSSNEESAESSMEKENEEVSSSSEPEQKNCGLLEETERVRSEYFNDAVFIGDSITTGISLYDIMPNAEVFASTGINLQSINTAQVVNNPDGGDKLTVLQALDKSDAEKVYIMLGANGLAFLGPETTMELYKEFVNKIKQIKPEAIIYVQSIFPIHEKKFAERYKGNLTNETIDETNKLLIEMAEELGVYYVNPAEIFKDETGGLMDEVTPDGLHFNSEYYTKWMDYLKIHAVVKK